MLFFGRGDYQGIMKTEAIKQQIISNYRQLSDIARVRRVDPNKFPAWGISYKDKGVSGFVNQIGVVERNGAKIRINGDEVELKHKAFFSTWKRTLNNINKMLQSTIENIENQDVVKKKIVNILCFSKEAAEKLQKAARH